MDPWLIPSTIALRLVLSRQPEAQKGRLGKHRKAFKICIYGLYAPTLGYPPFVPSLKEPLWHRFHPWSLRAEASRAEALRRASTRRGAIIVQGHALVEPVLVELVASIETEIRVYPSIWF